MGQLLTGQLHCGPPKQNSGWAIPCATYCAPVNVISLEQIQHIIKRLQVWSVQERRFTRIHCSTGIIFTARPTRCYGQHTRYNCTRLPSNEKRFMSDLNRRTNKPCTRTNNCFWRWTLTCPIITTHTHNETCCLNNQRVSKVRLLTTLCKCVNYIHLLNVPLELCDESFQATNCTLLTTKLTTTKAKYTKLTVTQTKWPC